MKTRTLLIALVAMFALLAAACGDDDDTTTTASGDEETSTSAEAPDGPPIIIGAQDFGESAILAQIYGQVLEANGYEVQHQAVGGFRDVLLAAFDNGEVNFSPEYAASMLEFLNDGAGQATGDAEETVELLQAELDEIMLNALEPAPAVDTNAFVVTAETSEAQGWEKISDLPADGAGVKLGAPQDCETNPFCLPGLQEVYGIDLSSGFTPLETSLVADALEQDAVQVGVLFSTSGRIADEGWVLLEDDQQMLAADNVVPVVKNELTDAYGDELSSTVDEVSAALTTEELTELNKRYEVDKEDAADVASSWLEDNDLAG
jgi:osmoprotectant transport system substrate-binding protein